MEPIFESAATFTPAQFGDWVAQQEERGDVNRYELLHGRIVMNPPAGWPHGELEMTLGAALLAHAKKLGRVFGSSQGFTMPSDDVVEPDVSFVSHQRWAAGAPRPGEFLTVVPELVIEILSPATASRDRGEKLGIYEQNGVLEYWQVDPRAKRIRVLIARDGRLQEDQLLEGDGIAHSRQVPGFNVSLAALFE